MKKLLQLAALSILIIFTSCSRDEKNKVKILNKNFGDQIQLTQNLVFSFSHDLVDDSLTDKWDTTDYLTFDPPIKGVYKFTQNDELIFSPSKGFAPSTNYVVKLNKELLSHNPNKELFIDKDAAYKMHTPYLDLSNMNAYWAREEGQVYIKLNLNFNYPVNPKDVAKLLKVKVDDGDVITTVKDGEAGNTVEVTIPAGDKGQENILIAIHLDKGLGMPGSSYITEDAIDFAQQLSSRFELQVLDVTSNYEGTNSQITVSTSQELVDGDLKSYYSVTPFVTTKAELTPNGMVITGDFKINTAYQFTLNTKAEGILGGKLKEDFTRELYFGQLPPSISFTNNKAIYLTSKGEMNIGVNITSVDKVKVKVFKIYENNIQHYMRSNRYYDYYDYYYDEYEYGYGGSNYGYREDGSGYYSDVIVDEEVFTKNLPKVGNVTAYNLNFGDDKKYKGIYLVSVASDNEYYVRATKLVSVSDIGLIAKRYGNSLLVFANSIKTAEPLSGVNINLISTNNQNMLNITTGSDGVARVDNIDEKAPGFELYMLTAKTNDDFNYMLFDQTGIETSRFDVGGQHDNKSGYAAYLYPERNLYRPGETLHGNVIVRDENWKALGDIPLKIRLTMPNGKEYETLKKNSNSQGAADFKFETIQSDVTGSYNVEVYNGNDVLLASQNISIEEFMPDRIKVRLKTDKEYYKAGDTLKVTTQANNLFGPPATNRNYDMEVQFSRKYFDAGDYSRFNFHVENKTEFSRDIRNGKTDAKGEAEESFYIPDEYHDMGVVEAKVYATVFDETGRPVNRMNKVNIYTQDVFYGSYISDYYVSTNQALNVDLIALNKDAKPLSGVKAKLELVRTEWQSVVERRNGRYKYVSKPVDKVVSVREVKFSSTGTQIKYVPNVSGEYEIRVYRPGAENYTATHFYAYTWGNTTNSSFEVSTEGEVLIETDKDKYDVGDKAKILFKAPFNGKLLVTLERNDVIEQFVVNTDKKSAEISVNIKEEYLPNIYVSATLIRPMDNSTMPLTVAHGFKPLFVEKSATVLPVEISMVEKSRSKTKQTIKIKTKPEENIEVTVAVVDEGILQVKGFTDPNPHKYFYQKRALEVRSYDMFAFLFPELSLNSRKSTGGDDFYSFGDANANSKRTNPLSNQRVKLVSFWSGILKTNSRGEASYTINIPQFSGDLRVMVVAYKNKAFGSASGHMKVADPLVLSAGIPRFANLGDKLKVPLNIVNTTGKDATATATISVKGPLNIISEKTQTVKVPANSEGWAEYDIKADEAMGVSNIKLTVKGLGETFTHETDLTVRPSVSLTKKTDAGSISAGSTEVFSLTNDYLSTTYSNKLVVSKSPVIQFLDKFDYLVGYPHGCLEQTISKAFPQIYFAEFIKQMDIGKRPLTLEGETELNPNFNVKAAIQKVQGLQRYDGAFSYWHPGSYESWWGSAYAIHFLVEAKKAGFDVSESVINKGISYLTYKTNTKQTEEYYYYGLSGRYSSVRAKRETMYSLYVLANAGQPNKAVMNYYKANKNLITDDGLYLLAGAYSLMGDNRSYNQIVPNMFREDRTSRSFGGSFASPIRNQALALATLVEVDINNPQVGELARHLAEQMLKERYLSTQESVFTFLALGKLTKKSNSTNITATVTANGKPVGTLSGSSNLIIKRNLSNSEINIKVEGSGNVYYYYEMAGVSASGTYTVEDKYIKARRTYYDRFGKAIYDNNFKQNDLIIVELSLKSILGERVDNIALTDMLPAGFEIENPRLTGVRGMDWITSRSYPDHFDVRDDRIHFYCNLYGNNELKFYYMVRAVSKGTFNLGPVMADAMYNGEYHSYNGGGKVIVE